MSGLEAVLDGDQTYARVARSKFHDLKSNFGLTKNILTKFWKIESTKTLDNYFDYHTQINMNDSRTLGRDEANRDTPKGETIRFYRRTGVTKVKDISLISPAYYAAVMKRSRAEALAVHNKVCDQAIERGFLQLMIESFTAAQRENPLNNQHQVAGVPLDIPFRDFNRIMMASRLGTGGAYRAKKSADPLVNIGQYRAPLRLNGFMYLSSLLENAVKNTHKEKTNEGTGTMLGDKYIILMSNDDFAAFHEINIETLNNRDTFGQPVLVGSAKIYKFQNFDIVTLPDELLNPDDSRQEDKEGILDYLPDVDVRAASQLEQLISGRTEKTDGANQAANDAVNNPFQKAFNGLRVNNHTFPVPTSWEDQNTLIAHALSGDNFRANPNNNFTKFASTEGLRKGYVFDPRAMKFWTVDQVNIDRRNWQDQFKMFEDKVTARISLQSVRCWDPLMYELYFTRHGYTGRYYEA